MYFHNCCTSAGSKYKIDMFGSYYQVFDMYCTGRGGVQRTNSNFVCNKIFALWEKIGSKICQTIKDHAKRVLMVEEALSGKGLTIRDHTVMVNLSR